ncbi:MAG: GNAT family N-acetyltransferase [Hyphomicrobiaceae bacterium]|nr:GNAT family N-acetyltransferase [Hyphomicrobiaceae bacterium]
MSFTTPALLTADHDTSTFDCGKPALNIWLTRHALINQEAGAARTVVVCTGKRVVGYYALAAGSVVHTQATGKVRRNMPDPVPMALLGRLAVDQSAHGFGIGAGLLQDAMLRTMQAAALLGIRGILVDALDDDARAFYEKYGFRSSTALPLKLMVTLAEVERALAKLT